MFAIIRVRFPSTPASAVWTDSQMQNWFDPNITYSMAHYWTKTAFSQADLRYYLFPAIELADPRTDPNLQGAPRDKLVAGVLNEITRLYDPDWDLFERYIIWFAQRTDMFGGGVDPLKTRPGSDRTSIIGAVLDIDSPFDASCQEVGHALGFDHEVTHTGAEYASPYSTMSAMVFRDNAFVRPKDTRLPSGTQSPPREPPFTDDVQRIIGPYMPAIHLYAKNYGAFVHPDSVIQVPETFAHTPVTFWLSALDKAVSSWPKRLKTLAILPPLVPGGSKYGLEIRRPQDYDQGLSLTSPTGAANDLAGLVIHSINPTTGRIVYENLIPFTGDMGDRDFRSTTGDFTIRLNSFSPEYDGASITVGGGEYWKHFGVSLDPVVKSVVDLSSSAWETVVTRPCMMFAEEEHSVRSTLKKTQYALSAVSYGFEDPHYTWFAGDTELVPTQSTLTVTQDVRSAAIGGLQSPHAESISFSYQIVLNRLTIETDAPFSGISLNIRVVAREGSTTVNVSLYPEQTVWTNLEFNNIEIEWGMDYLEQLVQCWKEDRVIELKYTKASLLETPHNDPRPKFEELSIATLLSRLVEENPATANAVIDKVADITNLTRLDILKEL